jgi:LacI family transcriptional regulator
MEDTHKVVTLQDVARQVGVHKSTVHRALRGDPRVEEGTAERIRAAATKLGYDPDVNQAARRLSLRKSGRSEPTRLISLLYPVVFTRGAYFQRIYTSFVEELSLSHHDVLIRINDKDHLTLPSIVSRGEADAVVTLNHPEHLAVIFAAMANLPTSVRRPIISLLNPQPNGWLVNADMRLGGREQMHHVLDLGHRRIITFGRMAFGSDERVAGCREALKARGMNPQRHLTVADPDNRIPDVQRLAEVLDRALAQAPDATAILAPHDPAAQQLLPLLAERGRPVPERMSLVGFDDTDPILDAANQNILTSVAVPLEQIGREAARMAMNPGPAPRTVMLPVGIRLRGTTSALR